MNLTDQYGRVPAQIDYDDWGKVTAYQSLNISGGYRTVLPEITYAGHQYDDVLGMYYAKARMYDAENRRFASVDPMKGQIVEPLSLAQYLYVVDNPLRWVDPLGCQLTGTGLLEMCRQIYNDTIGTQITSTLCLRESVLTIARANVSTTNYFLHNIAQALSGAYIMLHNPGAQIFFEYYISSQDGRGYVDIFVQKVKNNIRMENYLFEVKPKNSHAAGVTQLSGYYKILTCAGETYSKTSTDVLPEGIFIRNLLIFSSEKYDIELSLNHHGDGVITYQAYVRNKRPGGKNTENIASSGAMDIIIRSGQMDALLRNNEKKIPPQLDSLVAKLYGKPLSKMTQGEIFEVGLTASYVAGNVILIAIGLAGVASTSVAIAKTGTLAPYTVPFESPHASIIVEITPYLSKLKDAA